MDVQLLNDSRTKQRRGGRRRNRQRLPYVSPSLPTSKPFGYQPPIIEGQAINENEFGIGSSKKTIENVRSKPSNQHYARPLSNRIDRYEGSAFDKSKSEGVPNDLSGGLFSHGFCWMQCVRTQELGITENFGEFQEIVGPGLYCMAWPFNSIAGRLSLRIQQLDIVCETKTSDNVFVRVMVSVFFRVIVPRAYDAYYRLSDPAIQIRSFVLDVIRSTVPKLSLDEAFTSTSDITDAVFCRLHQVMKEFGYEIVQTLITELRPNMRVKASMNAVKAARSLKEAMSHQAEVERVKIIKNAEAHAEELYLSGVGTANARVAMAKSWSNCVQEWPKVDGGGVSDKDVMELLLQVQYMDTLTAIGADSFIFPSGISEVLEISNA